MKKILTVVAWGYIVPVVSFAQQDIDGLIFRIKRLLDLIIPILITLGLVYFLYGVGKYILKAGNEDARKEARNIMIYGIIALFVMVAIWGLVFMISSFVGVFPGGSGYDLIPTLNP